MSELIEQVEEALVIDDRASKIDQLIADLRSGEKKLSYSAMKAFRQSPNDFIDYCFREKEQTEAMFLGSIIHCLVLEPEKFAERYTIMDDRSKVEEIGGGNPRNTNLYKAWKAEFIADCTGEVVPFKTYKVAEIVANNIKYNRASSKVLSICDGETEKYVEWQYKNFNFHGYIDKIGKKALCDIKLVPDASPRAAQATIIKNWHYGQAGMYLTAEGLKLPYYVICADRKGGVSVHKLHTNLIDHALNEYSDLVDKFNECLFKENFNQSYDFFADSYDGIFICDKPNYLY